MKIVSILGLHRPIYAMFDLLHIKHSVADVLATWPVHEKHFADTVQAGFVGNVGRHAAAFRPFQLFQHSRPIVAGQPMEARHDH